MTVADIVQSDERGLYCPAGNFYVDPWQPCDNAIITHAHGDHALIGSQRYFTAAAGESLLRARLNDGEIIALPYGEQVRFNNTLVSLHPAGHILGSAQVRIEVDGKVCVVSGDYKRVPDPTCVGFEMLRCDVFVTESTFALPVYRWPSVAEVISEILAWREQCAQRGIAAVLFCYALGKAQRILAELLFHDSRPVFLHGAMMEPVACYRRAGIKMVDTVAVAELARGSDFAGELILAPPSASRSPWMRRFKQASTGFASGWMRIRGNRRRYGYDRGFVLSDHADWPALIDTVNATGAHRVLVTHGNTEALVPYLRELGLDAQALPNYYDKGKQ